MIEYAEDKKRITPQFLKKFLRSDFKLYYTTPSLNDKLYLHYKGVDAIENLEAFTGLKVIYLEGNGFRKIEGLQTMTQLKCLYLQENCIKKIENLETLADLNTLNLTDNLIETVENLGKNTKLQSLLLKRNRIGINGLSDLRGLLELPELTVLDISDNKITDEKFLEEIIEKIPKLAVLYSQGNEFTKKIPNYRKVAIARIPTLKYLDDRPVFDEDRRYAEAFYKGGIEAEREERKKYKQEQEDKHLQNHLAFKEMIEKCRKEREENFRAQGIPVEQAENSANSQEHDIQSDSQHDDQIPDLEDAASEEQKQEKSTDNSQSLTTYNSEPSERPSTPSSNHSVRDKKREFEKLESGESKEESLDSSFDSKRKKSVQGDSSSERGDHDTDMPNLSAISDSNNKTNYLDELE